ncbi:MAG: hypothetical protein CVV24_00765 [Ignavibacteriae bacterium HGW-Ignavibacteriae-3]|nr:MAG: hypothetical protein CVV24_00765 [Ignavibacteriae bacterium HGW-Ignavibacteriae-3]
MKKYMVLILLTAIAIPMTAQQEKNHDVSSEVKELTEFHDVIYQIWHTAWPEKNMDLLKSFSTPVEKGYERIKKAKLPGILRDKKAKWEDELKKFGVTVEAYKVAASKNNLNALLNAAEKLHSQYESLVRVTKPVLKEVDEFHKVLYLLYHYYMPENNSAGIKEAAASLTEKMEMLSKAPLTSKLKAREEQFNKARTELGAAVENLNNEIKDGKGKDDINKAVDALHAKYQELEKVFD